MTPLLDHPGSGGRKGDNGFTLLEVIVALSIMAIGFVTVLHLFSGSINSAGLSEQYLKAVTLANSRLAELELGDFQTDTFSGTFKEDETYRWELEILPYDSPLNDPENNINLSQINLKVSWSEGKNERQVELTTLRIPGTAHPASDSVLAKVFNGGVSQSQPDTPEENNDSQPDAGSGSSGTGTGAGSSPPVSISGAPSSSNISGF